MAIDLENDTLLSFAEATRRLPGRPHRSTLHRWRLRGVNGVRLGTIKVGGRRFIPLSQLNEFVASLSGENSMMSEPPSAALRRREREKQQAKAALTKAGI